MKYHINNIPAQPQFLFFWGHRPSKDGSIKKSCFSQWWKSDFSENSIVYKTAEQYMMAKKAELFNDTEIQNAIINNEDPRESQKLGRLVKGFNQEVWDNNKYEIVKQANLLKFGQNNELKSFIKGTGKQVLVEASPHDTIWGIGLTQHDSKALNPTTWKGSNLLGFALMEVRDILNQL
jgi:ribA/ribD-fused uncharacterized protein